MYLFCWSKVNSVDDVRNSFDCTLYTYIMEMLEEPWQSAATEKRIGKNGF